MAEPEHTPVPRSRGGRGGDAGKSGDQKSAEAMAADALRAAESAAAGLRRETDPRPAASAAANPAAPTPNPVDLPEFPSPARSPRAEAIDLLSDVNLNVKIELGRTRMLVEDVLRLGEGSVVELDKLAGDPVDIYVNDRPVARGEVLVLNDNFCVRINEIIAPLTADGR